ncbi:MAG: translation initiation factor IF-3 [Candidatus Eisenbacteria bacterium]
MGARPPGEDPHIRREFGAPATDRTRVNERIRAPMVRVIGDNGEQIGIMAVSDALKLAREQGLDLVEVAPQARPPVCRVMDYGRYRYEQSKRLRKAKKSHQSQLKEIKLRPKIGDHDLLTKLNHAREFFEKRDKVKFTVRFRGREIVHIEFGEILLRRVMAELQEVAVVEVPIRREGYVLTMVMTPKGAS